MIIMKKVMSVFVPILTVCMACLLVPAIAISQQADWTVLVYFCADNDVEEYAIPDFLEMASVGSTADVKIVALFDRIPGYDDRYGDWTDTRRGIINNGDVPNTSWGVSMGELNMGDPQTLIDFVVWGMQNYPASRYAVVLWNHGSGWWKLQAGESFLLKGVCWDYTDSDCLTMKEVRQALDAIEQNQQEPDLVAFNACLMAMVEVAYEIRDHAQVMVGSEKLMPATGFPYGWILEDLVATPSMTASELGSTMVAYYYQYYGMDETLSSTNLASMDNLASEIDLLAQTLRNDWASDPVACVVLADRVMRAVDNAVIAVDWHVAALGNHGLAIYFPHTIDRFDVTYHGSTILFARDTQWRQFLLDFYAQMGGSWVAAARNGTRGYDVDDLGHYDHVDLYDFCRSLAANVPGVIWVDFSWNGPEIGSYGWPYNTLAEAVAAASGGETVFIKAGSSAETITINKPLTLRAFGGVVTVGQ
jgi:hypothetical protein